MSTKRGLVFQNNHIYHVFNRGVERRPIFLHRSDYVRACNILEYYSLFQTPIKYSDYCKLSQEVKKATRSRIPLNGSITTLSFCFMPNHFHLLLRQQEEAGIQQLMMKLQTSYVKFFNFKYDRVGPLFQGEFKAVHIETDEQLIHVNRYIHLNPVVSGIIDSTRLETYKWSSLPYYLDVKPQSFIEKTTILNNFPSIQAYKTFIIDQLAYAKELHTIKHLVLED